MKNNFIYLRGSREGWSIEPLGDNTSNPKDTTSPSAIADTPRQVLDAIAQATPEHAQGSVRIVLGLPAEWCLCASVSAEGLPTGRGKSQVFFEALAYRLEAALPITVEDYTVGFANRGDKAQHTAGEHEYLGIATRTDRLKPLIHVLEDAGHEIEAIVPAALLIAPPESADAASGGIVCLWRDETVTNTTESERTHLVRFKDGDIHSWRCLSADPDHLIEQLRLEVSEPLAVSVWHTCPDLTRIPALAFGQTDEPAPHCEVLDSSRALERDAARQVAEGACIPLINLRQGELAPRHHWRRLRNPAIAAIAAAFTLLLCALAVMMLRAQQLEAIAAQHDERARLAFTQALPDQDIPTSPQRRLEGRLKQLRGEQGLAAGEDDLLEPMPALIILQQALTHLPENQRFALTDLRIEDGTIRLTGQARSHGEADQLAGALRQQGRFTVDPPSTENLPDGGVRFTLQATPPPPEARGEDDPGQEKNNAVDSSLARQSERGAAR